MYTQLTDPKNLDTYNKLKNITLSTINVIDNNDNVYNIVILKNLNKTQFFADIDSIIKITLKTLLTAKITFLDLKKTVDIQTIEETLKTLYDELVKPQNLTTLTKLQKFITNTIQININGVQDNIKELKILQRIQIY